MELSGEIRDRIFPYIDQHQDEFVENLRQVVEVPSVSQQREYRDQTIYVVELFKTVGSRRRDEETPSDLFCFRRFSSRKVYTVS